MDYDVVWKTLDALLLELRKKGSNVAQDVVDDLKSARTLINIYAVDPTSTDTLTQIEEYLRKVEAYLLLLAEADYDAAYADVVMGRIQRARLPRVAAVEPAPSQFIPGIMPGQHWVRIDTRDTVSQVTLNTLATELGLTLTMQGAHHAVIRGDEAAVKRLLKRVAEKTRRAR